MSYQRSSNGPLHCSGCSYTVNHVKHYLPQLKLDAHTTILSNTSRTTLNQTFSNPSSDPIKQSIYTFPLYDGVSVVAFTCRLGSRVLKGLVKERSKAKATYDKAVSRGETAGLLEQLPEASGKEFPELLHPGAVRLWIYANKIYNFLCTPEALVLQAC